MFNGVAPPWYRESPAEWIAFNLYAMECEGLFSNSEETEEREQDISEEDYSRLF